MHTRTDLSQMPTQPLSKPTHDTYTDPQYKGNYLSVACSLVPDLEEARLNATRNERPRTRCLQPNPLIAFVDSWFKIVHLLIQSGETPLEAVSLVEEVMKDLRP